MSAPSQPQSASGGRDAYRRRPGSRANDHVGVGDQDRRAGTRANVEALVAAGRVEVVTLSEDDLRLAWERLGREEGVFCEPASAAGLAALEQPRPGTGHAVCIVTGHGLKDAGAVDELIETTASSRASTPCSRRSHDQRARTRLDGESRAGLRRGRRRARSLERAAGRGVRDASPSRCSARGPASSRSTAAISRSAHSRSSRRPSAIASRSSTASRSSAGSGRAPRRSRSASSPAMRSPGRGRRRRACSTRGSALEGHADNLAAALFGGACISWNRTARPRRRESPVSFRSPRRRHPGDAHEHRRLARRASGDRHAWRRGRERRRSGDCSARRCVAGTRRCSATRSTTGSTSRIALERRRSWRAAARARPTARSA